MPCRSASPERGRTWASKPGRHSRIRPVGMSARAPGASRTGRRSATAARDPCRRRLALVGRANRGRGHAPDARLPTRRSAWRRGGLAVMSRRYFRRATARRVQRDAEQLRPWAGRANLSTSSAVTRCTVLRSPPMMPVCGETSLARIQSAPLALRFFWRIRPRVPFRRQSRSPAAVVAPAGLPAMVFRMSGFSTSSSLGGAALAAFLIFSKMDATRQSATAAAKTAISQGSASVTAVSISCAVSTATRSTPAGPASWLGPETSVTRAPRARACGSDGRALLARGAVGDIAHRVDRLVRGTTGDDHVASG